MKKKLFLLLLIVALAAFVFTGCTPPTPSEGEGEGEGEIEGVVVEIEGQYEIAGRTYVRGNENLDITVTFPAPVSGMATADVSDCSGDYGKGVVALWPNADRTVWTGSVNFNCAVVTGGPCVKDTCEIADCCASIVTVNAGECGEDGTCVMFPVIVDCDNPYLGLEVSVDDCWCAGCEITFKSFLEKETCKPDATCCGDNCSGLAGWSLSIYDAIKDPFDKCCDLTCVEPIWTASGTDCDIDVKTSCLDGEELYDDGYFHPYILLATVEDNVGNVVKGVFSLAVYMTTNGEEEYVVCCINITEYTGKCEDKWEGYSFGVCGGDCEYKIELGDACGLCENNNEQGGY